MASQVCPQERTWKRSRKTKFIILTSFAGTVTAHREGSCERSANGAGSAEQVRSQERMRTHGQALLLEVMGEYEEKDVKEFYWCI